MRLPVVLQPEAEEQIVASAQWWAANRSVEQSKRWYAGILKAIASLDTQPARFPLARENSEYDHELRELHFGLGSRPTHRILFVIAPDAIRVLTVRHAAQDDWDPDEA